MNAIEKPSSTEDAPTQENIVGIGIWTQFEKLGDAAKHAIFESVVQALHFSSAAGLTMEQLENRKATLQRLIDDVEHSQQTLLHQSRKVVDYEY